MDPEEDKVIKAEAGLQSTSPGRVVLHQDELQATIW